jgi:hypothetical protein
MSIAAHYVVTVVIGVKRTNVTSNGGADDLVEELRTGVPG